MARDLSEEIATKMRQAADAWRGGDSLPVLHPGVLWGDEPRGDLTCLRIGLVTDTYLPVANGVTHLVAQLARTLAARGHEPHIFTFTTPGAVRAARRDHDGVLVHHAGALPISRSGYYFGVRYPMHMKRRLRQMDIVHVHHPFISGRLVWRLVRPEQPLVFTNHTRYDIYGHYLQQWMPFVPEDVVQERLTYSAARFANRCDVVVSPSASAADVMRGWGIRAPIDAIPNGIDLARFHAARAEARKSDKARLAFRAAQQLPAKAPVIVYLGRLTQEKNVETLIRAFAIARAAVPEARLLLLGDGPSEHDLKTMVRHEGLADAVRFAGALPYAEVPGALAACDLFASASVSEVHPLTFIEAMAVGLPCVGTLSPGVADTIENGVDGWLCEAEPETFGQALIHALSSPEERRQVAEAAYAASSGYSIDGTADRMIALYRQVIEARLN